jgi:hypothetical protein
MDDRIFIACIMYLVFSISIIGFLPSEFFVGTSGGTNPELNTLKGYTNSTGDSTTGYVSVGFFYKLITFLFASWQIAGVPILIGLFIFVINLFCILIGAIWTYDKIRGIP